MIEVHELTKSFGGVRALREVSFTVEEGEILGFLGPNGAGKSTTMRILTGFLPGDSGTVRVAGHDVSTDSLVVRRELGYLPEGVPLYPEMRVSEYLRFRARLKGVPRRERGAFIGKALEQTGTTEVSRQIIGTLSRGFRQRVGLADALLAEPRVLILDEPTVGLDPEQVRQFRELLRSVGRDRTVILSTHILSEVEIVCSTVAIIRKGTVVARDRASDLRRRVKSFNRVVAEISGPEDAVRRRLRGIESVSDVTVESLGEGFGRFVIDIENDGDLRAQVFDSVRDSGWRLRELRREESSLEDVFVEIVGEVTT